MSQHQGFDLLLNLIQKGYQCKIEFYGLYNEFLFNIDLHENTEDPDNNLRSNLEEVILKEASKTPYPCFTGSKAHKKLMRKEDEQKRNAEEGL